MFIWTCLFPCSPRVWTLFLCVFFILYSYTYRIRYVESVYVYRMSNWLPRMTINISCLKTCSTRCYYVSLGMLKYCLYLIMLALLQFMPFYEISHNKLRMLFYTHHRESSLSMDSPCTVGKPKGNFILNII